MGLLNQTKRVEFEGGEWVEVKILSIGALREMRQVSSQIKGDSGEDADEAQGFALTKLALEACIVAWSDEAPVTPDNIDKLPYSLVNDITTAIGLGEKEVPLESGPSSTDTSEA